MHKHWSLVIFTLSIQCAVGGVWCMQFTLFFTGNRIDFLALKYHVFTFLCLVLSGLAAAMAHLGKPGKSPQALKNLKSSWLSREISSVSLFAGVLAFMVVLAGIHPVVLRNWMMVAASLTGAAALYAMIGVYRLRTVPSWNHAGTSLSFLGSAILLGGLLSTLVSKLLTLMMDGQAPAGQGGFQTISFLTVLAGFVLKLLAAGVCPSRESTSGPDKILLPVIQGAGILMWVMYILIGGGIGFSWILLSFSCISLISGEIIQRSRFYHSYQRVGL